jgi:ABC-type branched-subunit amino acid transport system ATPase component
VNAEGALSPAKSGLEIDGVTVRFGGLMAVNAASLSAPMGQITGLIGPNGAGKTTIFNACCGLVPVSGGQVLLHGQEVTGLSPAARARRGLGRTFQQMQLFDSMTVVENVQLGREIRYAANGLVRQLYGARHERLAVAEATAEALETCGIAHLANRFVGALPVGQRRLVELARILAGEFDILLLDEPSSGLDTEETERFGGIVREVVGRRSCGVLIVEHDMALVMSICEYLYVLDFGVRVFDGTPEQTRASPLVRAAYLGEEDLLVGFEARATC